MRKGASVAANIDQSRAAHKARLLRSFWLSATQDPSKPHLPGGLRLSHAQLDALHFLKM